MATATPTNNHFWAATGFEWCSLLLVSKIDRFVKFLCGIMMLVTCSKKIQVIKNDKVFNLPDL
jgi:hypothetical protein